MLNKVNQFLRLSSLSFILGVSLCWFCLSIYRANWDGLPVFSLKEFWLSSLLLLSSIIIFIPLLNRKDKKVSDDISVNISSDNPTLSSAKQYIILIIFGVMGILLVVLWHLQIMEKNISLYTDNQIISHSPVYILTSSFTNNLPVDIKDIKDSRCVATRHFLNKSIIENNDWKMSVFDKIIIKKNFSNAFIYGCITDKEMFDLVQKLRFRQTLQDNLLSASFNWSFFNKEKEQLKTDLFEESLLPITKQEWCVKSSLFILRENGMNIHSLSDLINNKISLFCSLQDNPDEIIIHPIQYNDLAIFSKKIFEENK